MHFLPKILIVDDEVDVCQDIGHFLKMKDYLVVTANSGKQALRLVVVERPDLILLDIRMPEMDGLECLRQIKTIDLDVPVIMVTCVTDVDIAKMALELGAKDYILKPFDFERLETAILMYLFLKSQA
ncbi:MAG: response regulator [Candidatus Omnitrophota bacterium]|nr:response regulator [Candidatus Omnitrophota bacterium]